MSEYQKLWLDLKRHLMWDYESKEDSTLDLMVKSEILAVILKMDKMETLLLVDAEG
ncbi:hypothetical protein [Diplocloster agilis]|uniref:hypothetical protein n=1 Tax=Diplocloster agilis TaxID=2850323 RepID=UPI000822DE77|nr:hypothetical protein [Suonthocola fibrivorans]MCU6734915.1 hypothetical protein [Suonthocola fibrivorans]SCJ58861.1 Uncharacterised protein [uncultured Clostridium sp.]